MDFAGTRRSIRDMRPLVYSPYVGADAPDPFIETAKAKEAVKEQRIDQISSVIEEKPKNREFTIMDALAAHEKGAHRHGAAQKDFLHGFLQFPTDIKVTEKNQRLMLAIGVDFINRFYGGNAVFHGRIDRDEKGQHGVDVFFAPRYEKHTKYKGTEQWISLSKFSKDNARSRLGKRQKQKKNRKTKEFEPIFDNEGNPVMVWNDGKTFQGSALQDSWYEHLQEHIGQKYEVERGKQKQSSGPDQLSPEDYAFEQEQKKLRAEVERQLNGDDQSNEEDAERAETAAKLIKQAGERAQVEAKAASDQVLIIAEESARSIRDTALKSVKTDVEAITRAMMSADAAEFAALRNENSNLQKEVLRLGRIVTLISKVLKAVLPKPLRETIEKVFKSEWSEMPGSPTSAELQVGNAVSKDDGSDRSKKCASKSFGM
ncbi:MAG: hypothetical protein ABJF50_13045 [Paracoccaceae bacterium]